ncbi:MAG: aminotransferase class I/II-fold pyridoxal phosphate-dependent enzyme [Caldilineaceae bacterium]|nr:aminotransferase class I/II-fold pyridoxal phosphate-dependent enzyme [Caldilineaceae bacterium]
MRYAEVVNHLEGQGYGGWRVHMKARQMIAAGIDVILLTIGDPDFDTPTPIVDAAVASLRRGRTHYVPAAGELALRKAIAAHHARQTGQLVSHENVAIMQGAQCGLYVATQCVLQPGDEVILTDPVYSTYPPTIGATGAKAVYVPLHAACNFHPDLEEIAAAITPHTRAILLNTPHNPTGSVLRRDEFERLADLVLEHDLWLITDEVYSNFTYTHPHFSPAGIARIADRCVTISSLSKSHAMTGWRVGWIVGPTQLIQYADLLLSVMAYGGAPFIQDGALVAFTTEIAEVETMRLAYRRRAEVVAEYLSDTPGIHCCETEGGMYALLDVRDSGLPSMEVADQLCAEAHVALLPGDAFGPNLQGYLRLSLVVPEARLVEACERVRRFAVAHFGS